jgi:tRNA-specific 2-thiouridylase
VAKGKALVAMSGGVDSSVTALLLQQADYECVGATMRLYDSIRIKCSQPTCCSLDDVEDARKVAARLGMPFEVLDFRDDFESQVIDRFVSEYARGRTPNPCILCNRHLKFDRLMQAAESLGCDFLATGHYARVEHGADGRFHLRCGLDAKKDQSYVLYTLEQSQLERLLLPLGGLSKAEVRSIAEENGLVNARKRESQDICFVPDGDYAGFLAGQGVTGAPGAFLDQDGEVLGTHRGVIHYTIGQRKGLGIALGHPVYVTAIDAAANTVTVGPPEALSVQEFFVEDVVWTSGDLPAEPVEAEARTHYHARRVPVRIHVNEGGGGVCLRASARIEALGDLRAVAPGQAAVFYQGDEVIGGGTIAASVRTGLIDIRPGSEL